MKFSLVCLTSLLMSFAARADLAEFHYKQMCQSDEAKVLIGETGSCIILNKDANKPLKGSCTGLLAGKIPCTINYDTSNQANGQHVVCGEDSAKPILSSFFSIEPTSAYTVSSLIKNSEGKHVITNDPNIYGSINSSMVQMIVVQAENQAPMAFILFALQEDNILEMQNVTCEAQR